MWTYLNRVLIPHQIAYAAAHDQPRGNFSDLYPRWLGAKELLLHGRDPYSPEVTREIQAGYYGRPLDSSRPDDPRDQQAFAYPVYVVFFLAPTIGLPFATVQKVFFGVLVAVTCLSVPLWLRMLRWPVSIATKFSMMALVLGSMGGMQGLKLQQISLLVAGLIALAMVLLAANRPLAAGVLLAVASIKPQIVLLLLIWLALWTLADWRRRYRWAASYLLCMAILCAASEWILPHWISRFWHAVLEYWKYTSSQTTNHWMGAPLSWAFEFGAAAALLGACWRERGREASSEHFGLIASMTLAVTVMLVPMGAQYNQVFLLPGVLLLVKERRPIWRRSPMSRTLFVVTMVLLVWPWVASTVLAGLSFILPQARVESAWAMPIWTTVQLPIAVAALILLHYYTRTFTASAGAETS